MVILHSRTVKNHKLDDDVFRISLYPFEILKMFRSVYDDKNFHI